MLRKTWLAVFFIMVVFCCAMAEGSLVPDGFTFSGGSGKVELSCPEITGDSDGAYVATVVFSSPYYTVARVGEETFESVVSGKTSVFRLPIQPNVATQVYATTTAMSQPHEIEYTVFIRLDSLLGDKLAIEGVYPVSSLPLKYAECFDVDYYPNGIKLISIEDGSRYLLLPPDTSCPAGLDPDIRILRQPLNTVYLAATSAMAYFDALGEMDRITFSSIAARDWAIPNAVSAMECGEILYAGSYSAPDFELLVKRDCCLAIESTMIAHSPQIREMLELLNIPVFIDYSSYEPHPLGRMEWIKLYGALTGREDEAQAFFDEKEQELLTLGETKQSGLKVAYFSLNSRGSAVVRTESDYITRMIRMAGGEYAFDSFSEANSAAATVTVNLEDFYLSASDADYLIYNATIEDEIHSIAELTQRNELFAAFKSVQNGNVWCVKKSLYQSPHELTRFIIDLRRMLAGETEGMYFLTKLD